jgi:hypothetical protein
MRKTNALAEALRDIRIHNNFELLRRFGAPGDVCVSYHKAPEGRLGWATSDKTMVFSPFPHKALTVEPLGVTHGKQFPGKRAVSFQLAVNWAMAEFGHDYEPSPFGGHIPSHIKHKARQAALKSTAAL